MIPIVDAPLYPMQTFLGLFYGDWLQRKSSFWTTKKSMILAEIRRTLRYRSIPTLCLVFEESSTFARCM